jgi:hypothetical protein
MENLDTKALVPIFGVSLLGLVATIIAMIYFQEHHIPVASATDKIVRITKKPVVIRRVTHVTKVYPSTIRTIEVHDDAQLKKLTVREEDLARAERRLEGQVSDIQKDVLRMQRRNYVLYGKH